jgi:hypothetical protein
MLTTIAHSCVVQSYLTTSENPHVANAADVTFVQGRIVAFENGDGSARTKLAWWQKMLGYDLVGSDPSSIPHSPILVTLETVTDTNQSSIVKVHIDMCVRFEKKIGESISVAGRLNKAGIIEPIVRRGGL